MFTCLLKLERVGEGDHTVILTCRAMPMWSERCVSWPALPHRGALGTQNLKMRLWRCEETRSIYPAVLPEPKCWCNEHLWPSCVQAHRSTGDVTDLLLQKIIARLLALARAEDKVVRLRTCQLLQLIINNQVIGFRPQGNLIAMVPDSSLEILIG